MRTLLELFFIPYLRFLGKFHLIAIPVIGLLFALRINELVLLAPWLYTFALYATTNRHQFKDNIPWMLATFNKRTLVGYHLFSQTLVLAILVGLSTLGIVTLTTCVIWLMPESSHQVATDIATTSHPLMKSAGHGVLGTKEVMVAINMLVFFLTTIYSPVALKEYLRQMEEGATRAKWLRYGVAGVVLFVGLSVVVDFGLRRWMLPLLASVLAAQLMYILWMYNRAFVLFHSRQYVKITAFALALVPLFAGAGWIVAQTRYHSARGPEERVAEWMFMGALAPTSDSSTFWKTLAEVEDPGSVLELFSQRELAALPASLRRRWILKAQDFGVGLRLVESFSPQDSRLTLEAPGVGLHLENLLTKLKQKNPAAAAFQGQRLQQRRSRLPASSGALAIP